MENLRKITMELQSSGNLWHSVTTDDCHNLRFEIDTRENYDFENKTLPSFSIAGKNDTTNEY